MAITFNKAPVDVASEALGILGRPPLVDLEASDDPVAVQCLQFFSSLLRTMLREHDWNFARHRVELAQNTTAPVSEWSYGYALPPDCYRVLKLNGSDTVLWKIEGRNLVTDESVATIEYIRWVDDPNEWDASFYQAFVTYLSVRLAPALNVDTVKSVEQYKIYQAQLLDAKAIDGQEGSVDRVNCLDLTDDIRE